MRNRRIVLLAVVLAAATAAAPLAAYPWCAELACFNPPRAYCSAQCWRCGPNSGTDYDGVYFGTCEYPTLVTVGDHECPCLQSSTPDLGESPEVSLEDLLSVPAPAGEKAGLRDRGTSEPAKSLLRRPRST